MKRREQGVRAAIIGLYNSGSTALSQIVEKLGFEIGYPLWEKCYESRSLRAQLIDWWSEPKFREEVEVPERLAFLRWWIAHHEAKNPLVCAKHPLLCFSAYDLLDAWGDGIKLIRASRPLADSIAGLTRRGWFPQPERMQRSLYTAAEKFFDGRDHLSISFDDLVSEPSLQVDRLINYLGIRPTEIQRQDALNIVQKRPEKPTSSE